MQFILIGHDKEDGLALRKEIRASHLTYLREIASQIVFGGPILGDDGAPYGSMIVYEAEDRAAAERLVANDPYSQNGLFARTELRPFKTVIRDGAVNP